VTIFKSSGLPAQPATEQQITDAEHALDRVLPSVYKDLLRVQNGGYLVRTCFPTDFPSSWAEDHIAVRDLWGVGDADSAIDGEFGSRYMVREWEYPDIGLVIFGTPSGGHDTVMLDYTVCGADGEPSVAYVDEDRVPRQLAASLTAFLAALTEDSFD
jgi:hypothetical protein